MIILDTNVFSELSRPDPAIVVINWLTGLAPSDAYLTTITEAELRYGIEMLPAGRRRERLHARNERLIQQYFVGRVLPFTRNAARSYAVIAAARKFAGQPISHPDCQIAAIAHSVGASVATRNVKDFEGCGIRVINPWEAS